MDKEQYKETITNDPEKDLTLTYKESYEVMLEFLESWYKLSESEDITDILSPAKYHPEFNEPMDIAFWWYWKEAIGKIKLGGNNPKTKFKKP